nr:MAG TPA: hypothetical protein [Caudoviricetes sp.]
MHNKLLNLNISKLKCYQQLGTLSLYFYIQELC